MKKQKLIKVLVAVFPFIWGIITAGLLINLVVEYEFYVKVILVVLSIVFAALIPMYVKNKAIKMVALENALLKAYLNCLERKTERRDNGLPE